MYWPHLALLVQPNFLVENSLQWMARTGWLLFPLVAALAMSLISASVIGNALRLANTSPSANGDVRQ